MMGTAHSGKGFRGVLNYVLDKEREAGKAPEIIGGTMDGVTARELAAEFAYTRDMKPDITAPIHHLTLSADVGEKIGREKWEAIAADHLGKLGYELEKTQYVVIQHHDTERDRWSRPMKDQEVKESREIRFDKPQDERGWNFHPAKEHVHIIACRIQTNAKVVSNHNDRYKVMESCREIERKHGLNLIADREGTRLLTNSEKKRVKENKQYPGKARLQAYILEAKAAKEIQPFVERLEREGVKLHPNLASTGRFSGFTYELEGQRFSGQQLGEKFKWNKLGVSYEPERDRSFLESRTKRVGLPGASERDPQREPEKAQGRDQGGAAERTGERRATGRGFGAAHGEISTGSQGDGRELRADVKGDERDARAVETGAGAGDRRTEEVAAAPLASIERPLDSTVGDRSDGRGANVVDNRPTNRRTGKPDRGVTAERVGQDREREVGTSQGITGKTPSSAGAGARGGAGAGSLDAMTPEDTNRRLQEIFAKIERGGRFGLNRRDADIFCDAVFGPTDSKKMYGEGRGKDFVDEISNGAMLSGSVKQGIKDLCGIHVFRTADGMLYIVEPCKGKQRELAAEIRKAAEKQLKWDVNIARRQNHVKEQPERSKQIEKEHERSGPRR
jgi:MobA/VirD2-like, nuclease domain